MRYVVHSGTDVQPLEERYDSAAQALEAVTWLSSRGVPNIRVTDSDGKGISIEALRDRAVEENESDDA